MAILTVLFRWRAAVVGLLGLGAVAAAFSAFHGGPVPIGALFLATASAALAIVVSYVHLRHLLLAVLVVFSPLAGMMAVAPLADPLPMTALLAVYGVGYVVAALVAGDIARRVLDGRDRVDAARETLLALAAPVFVAALVGAPLLVAWLFRDVRHLGLAAACAIPATAASAALFTSFGASLMRFGEAFFTRANRARERREALLRVATIIVVPRWGLSLSGVTLVFAVLGWFGAAPLLDHSTLFAQPALAAGSLLGVFLVACAMTRDWREAAAAVLALGALALFSAWLWGWAVGHPTASAFVDIVVSCATAFLAMLAVAGRSRAYRRDGDDPAVARLRALEDVGAAPWFAALGAAAATAPWIVLHGSTATLAVLFLFAALAALVAQPAIATGLESIVPRRRSLDELYKRG